MLLPLVKPFDRLRGASGGPAAWYFITICALFSRFARKKSTEIIKVQLCRLP
jgi:hypothetical protein